MMADAIESRFAERYFKGGRLSNTLQKVPRRLLSRRYYEQIALPIHDGAGIERQGSAQKQQLLRLHVRSGLQAIEVDAARKLAGVELHFVRAPLLNSIHQS